MPANLFHKLHAGIPGGSHLLADCKVSVFCVVKHKDVAKLDELCAQIQLKVQGRKDLQYKELTGPFTPVVDKIRGEFIKCFYVKFARDNRLVHNKKALQECVGEIRNGNSIVLDVDPL
jgi:primosomal protein N'